MLYFYLASLTSSSLFYSLMPTSFLQGLYSLNNAMHRGTDRYFCITYIFWWIYAVAHIWYLELILINVSSQIVEDLLLSNQIYMYTCILYFVVNEVERSSCIASQVYLISFESGQQASTDLLNLQWSWETWQDGEASSRFTLTINQYNHPLLSILLRLDLTRTVARSSDVRHWGRTSNRITRCIIFLRKQHNYFKLSFLILCYKWLGIETQQKSPQDTWRGCCRGYNK